jgi:hypothetical protein
MTEYYAIKIQFHNKQLNDLAKAIHTKKSIRLNFSPNQLDKEEGEFALVTKSQLRRIQQAKMNNNMVGINFSLQQLAHMEDGMMNGEGFLDSISSLFSKATSGVKNFFTSKPTAPKVKVANPYKDYGPQYDNEKFGFKPPKKTTFDKVANKVNGFDNFIDKIFSY